MADVTFQREDFIKILPAWQLVDDVCAGERAVKSAGDKYLPRPNPKDTSDANKARYKQYVFRAQFYNATGFTLNGLIGEVFRVKPVFKKPALLEFLDDDADGAGVSIFQQSQKVTAQVLKKGRHCLFVDYPQTERPTTRAEQRSGAIRSKIISIDAGRVANWKVEMIGGRVQLSLVVIKETHEEDTEDGFGVEKVTKYRALRLIEGVYRVELWSHDGKQDKWVIESSYIPRDASGNVWREIPFIFVGSKNNDHEIDPLPLEDMANVNLSHYRNSADYEDSVYFIGQAQPWISGLTEQWASTYFGEGTYIGSRSPLLLPQGGAFGIEQAQANTMASEAMEKKEAQLVALGARLVKSGEASKTLAQTVAENGAQHSVLALVVTNVSDAYTKAIDWCARFEGATGEIEFELNSEFAFEDLDAPKITAIIAAWQAGLVPKSDAQRKLKQAGIIDPAKSQEDIDEETDNDDTGLDLDDVAPLVGVADE